MKGNLLKLQDLKKNNEWCDKSQVLLLACFQILVDFIEKEKPQRITDFKNDKEQKQQWKELQTLYHYWKRDRPRMEKELNRVTSKWINSRRTKWVSSPNERTAREIVLKEDKKLRNLTFKLDDRFEALENEMLQRLINMRHHLWC